MIHLMSDSLSDLSISAQHQIRAFRKSCARVNLNIFFLLATSQTVHLLLSRLSDGAARIFPTTLCRGWNSNSRQQVWITLWDLNSGLRNQLSYRNRGYYFILSKVTKRLFALNFQHSGAFTLNLSSFKIQKITQHLTQTHHNLPYKSQSTPKIFTLIESYPP